MIALKLSARVVKDLIAISLPLSGLCLLPPWHVLLEINANFGAYYAVAHCVSLLVMFLFPKTVSFSRNRLVGIILGLLLVYHGSHLAPFYLKYTQESLAAGEKTASMRVLYANVETKNREKASFKEVIQTHSPQIVALLELDLEWSKALALGDAFPYRREILREDNFGLGLYSVYPFIGEPVVTLGEGSGGPVVLVALDIGAGSELFLALIHCLPPVTEANLHANKLLLRRLATQLRDTNTPTLVMGDLNATPWSEFYKRFVAHTGVANAMWGSGYLKTWNAKSWFYYMPIDHIFYRGGIRANNVKVLDFIGSDHYPLLVDLEIAVK